MALNMYEVLDRLSAAVKYGHEVHRTAGSQRAILEQNLGSLRVTLDGTGQKQVLESLDAVQTAVDHLEFVTGAMPEAIRLLHRWATENGEQLGAGRDLGLTLIPPHLPIPPPRPIKDQLATWPDVSHKRMKYIVLELFKGTRGKDPTGDGTTMDAIRNELAQKTPTAEKWHTYKGQTLQQALIKFVRHNPDASSEDLAVARDLIEQLDDALGGNRL